MVPRKVKWNPAMLFCLLAAAAVFGFTADRAAARPPSCGDTVKADVKLKADLEGCPNNGLLIGANGVEIDLNGHTISGDGKDHRPCPNGACDLGIAIEHHKGVTVGGGRVTGFGLGIDVFKAAHVLVHDIDAPRNTGLGLAAFRSQDIAVQRLHANHNAFSGILYFGVTGGVVRASAANSDGLDTDQAGMSMIKSRDVRISHNTFARNGDIGFYSETVADVRIAHNRIVGNPEAGMFAVESSKRVEIRSNRISHAGDGIILDASHSRVARNRITDIQAPSGCPKNGCATGIAVEGSRDNRVVRNRVSRAEGSAIRVGVAPRFVPPNFRTRDNLVRANLVVNNGDGIFVEPNAVDSLLVDNRARRSRDDGIDVRRPATTLIDNRASRNGHLGIDAVANVRDGGGNQARNNGNPLQCVGLVCS